MDFTISPSIKDNHKRSSLGDSLKENISAKSELSIVSAYFIIFVLFLNKSKLAYRNLHNNHIN
jgi:hypothetical protein